MTPVVRSIAACGAALMMSLAGPGAHADPVDLGAWTGESFPAVAGFGAGVWTPAADGSSVHQSVNGQPTLFVSDFSAFGSDMRGEIRVNSDNDDDFIGFALGYRPGDHANTVAEYLLIDWKRSDQFFDFGAPSDTPGSTAHGGLAVSQVNGVPTADEFWGHLNFEGDEGGLMELQRGMNLHDTGWNVGQTYEFRFVFQPHSLDVFVDGQLELSITGDFWEGRMAFYNFSQADVTYSAFTLDRLPTPVPEPATWALAVAGLAGVGGIGRRRRAS